MNGKKTGIIRSIISAVVVSAPVALVFFFSDMPYTFSNPADSMLKLSIKHSGKRIVECNDLALLNEEAQAYRKTIREGAGARMKLKKLGGCSRERHPVYVELYVDGEKRAGKSYKPGGWEKDGPSFVYEKFSLSPGTHEVEVRLRDSKDGDGFDYTFKEDMPFEAGRVRAVGFDEAGKRLFVR